MFCTDVHGTLVFPKTFRWMPCPKAIAGKSFGVFNCFSRPLSRSRLHRQTVFYTLPHYARLKLVPVIRTSVETLTDDPVKPVETPKLYKRQSQLLRIYKGFHINDVN